MPIKAVLFDLDNTLIDFRAMKKASVDAALEAMLDAGLKASREKAGATLWKIYRKRGMEYQRVFQEMMRRLQGSVDYRALAAGVVAYKRAKESKLIPYPGVRKALEALRRRGIKLGVVSDAPRIQAWTRLAAMNLHKSFDFVIAFEETRRRKPSKMPFKLAIERLGLKPKEILFVGESLDRDVRGAKKAGMLACWARYGARRKMVPRAKAKPDYTIRNVGEIISFVAQPPKPRRRKLLTKPSN